MHIRTLIFSSKPPLIRVNGKPRLIWRKHPTPKTRRLIPGRVHHVSTFAFVALPEAATEKLKPSERAALVDWWTGSARSAFRWSWTTRVITST